MNSFEPKYLNIAKNYLNEKTKYLNVKQTNVYKLEDKKESTMSRLFHAILK